MEEVLCIHNGTRLEKIVPQSLSEAAQLRRRTCQELNIPENSKIALTVGRLSQQKGYRDLIPVVSQLVEAFPNLKFVWVGDGEYRSHLIEQLQKKGLTNHILLLGHRNDVPTLLNIASLFVFLTYYEELPFALLKAMAVRLPVVASQASSIPEVIEHGTMDCYFLLVIEITYWRHSIGR